MTSRIIIQSVDELNFTIDKTTAKNRITLIREMMEIYDAKDAKDVVFPILKVKGHILKLVLEWASHHRDDPIEASRNAPNLAEKGRTMSTWDRQFCMTNHLSICEMMNAVNYLQMSDMLQVLCKFAADSTKGKSREELRAMFESKESDEVVNEGPRRSKRVKYNTNIRYKY